MLLLTLLYSNTIFASKSLKEKSFAQYNRQIRKWETEKGLLLWTCVWVIVPAVQRFWDFFLRILGDTNPLYNS